MWNFDLSLRYLLSRRKERMISLIGSISILGVTLGVASLIIVMSVMNGFDEEVRDRIIGTYSHVMVMRRGGISGYGGLLSDIRSMPGVKDATPFINGQAVLRSGEDVTGILLRGVDPETESAVSEVIDYSDVRPEELSGDTIVIGSELMRSGGLETGDEVELLIPYSVLDMEKARLRVIGAFTSGRYDYDANIAIVGIDTARKVYRMGPGVVTGISLKLEDGTRAAEVKRSLQKELGYPFVIKSWMDLDRNLMTALSLEKKMMFVILALIVTVACFNISSSLIMMVMEKTRDIGIMRAIGANSFGVSSVFFLQGILIGFFGILLGAGAGIFLSERINEAADLLEKLTGVTVFPSDVYYFTEIPVRISVPDVTIVVSTAFALTLLAGVYPAWKASRMNPVEAIRYE